MILFTFNMLKRNQLQNATNSIGKTLTTVQTNFDNIV